MTKTQLQQELKQKVKEGIKPSHLKKLKRSKSADDIRDIPSAPPLPNQTCNRCPELKKQLDQANSDWIIASQKNLDYLKQWAEQNNKIKSLTKELNETIEDATEEINKEQKDKSQLRTKLSQAQNTISTLNSQLKISQSDLNSHQRAAELRLNNPFKDNSNFWKDYGIVILLLGTYLLSAWILRNKHYE